MENTKIFEMADRLKTLQEQKKDLEALTKALGAEIAELDLQLSDAMTESELDRFSRNGSTFYLKSRLYASPASGRKDEMMQALKENGYDSLVTETVNANTLASFIHTKPSFRWKSSRQYRKNVNGAENSERLQTGASIHLVLQAKLSALSVERITAGVVNAREKILTKFTTFGFAELKVKREQSSVMPKVSPKIS